MFKKVLSLTLSVMMIMAFVAIPSMAAEEGSFSEANWHQYERGFYTSTSDFAEYFKEYEIDSDGDENLVAVKMVASSGKTLTSNRNPVAYKFGVSASDYGEYQDVNATYAHMRFYLASFSDQYRNATNKLQLRLDKDGTGSSRDAYLFHTWKEGDNFETSVYPASYSSSAAYTSKDWMGIAHQGGAGNGPADNVTANSHQTAPKAEDYDKVDLIVEYNKQGGATSYIFVNGKFMGSYYDSGLTDKHFHGIVLRIASGQKTRGNSDYVAAKFDTDRVGHREYYNTDDYMVTMEDVMQDAGLGAELDEENMIYKSKAGDLEWYMPGYNYGIFTDVYTYERDYSERQRINENITYSGTAATIEATNTDTENYATAAKMLSGFYPINGKTGISYESYHPRAKYIKLSFDQTISNDGMWLKYETRYSGTEQALQMWNNNGNLVVGVKGGSNITCNGSGYKPTATTTGTNHIDWILEPVETGTDEGYLKQYVYVNGKLASEGKVDSYYANRVNDIILSTKNAEGTVTIDNWTLSTYNQNADFAEIESVITGVEPATTFEWMDAECAFEADGALFVIFGAAEATRYEGAAKLYIAVYGESGALLDLDIKDFESGLVYGNEEEPKIFDASAYAEPVDFAVVYLWENGTMKPLLEQKIIELN